MKENATKEMKVPFYKIEIGKVFIYESTTYIKTVFIHRNATNLSTGCTALFLASDIVVSKPNAAFNVNGEAI